MKFYKFLFVILFSFSAFSAHAGTEFQCEVVAVSAAGSSIPEGRITCSANVVYFNMESGEQQDIVRNCRIRRDQKSCSKTFDDAGVLVGFPVISAISGYSKAAYIGRYANRGCVQDISDLITDSDDFGNHTVQVTQRLSCP